VGAPLPLFVTRQQPAQIVPIDADNPITVGLLSARTGIHIPTNAPGLAGRYMTRTSTGGLVNPDIIPSTSVTNGTMTGLNAVTFVALIRRNNASNSGAQWASRYRSTGSVNATTFGLGFNAYNSNTSLIFTGPTNSVGWTAPGAPASGEVMFIAGVWDKVNNLQTLYVNGVAVATGAAGANAIPANGYTMYEADCAGGNTNTGVLPFANLIYGRALTPAEIYALYLNIWQVWTPPMSLVSYAVLTSSAAAAPAVLLAASGSSTSVSVATLTAAVRLSGAGVSSSSGGVALSSGMALSTASMSMTLAAAAVSAGIVLAAAGASAGTAGAAMAAAVKLSVAGAASSSGNAALSTNGASWTASGSSVVSAGAVMSTSVRLTSAGVSPSTSGSALTSPGLPWAASGVAPSRASCALTATVRIATAAIAAARASAALTASLGSHLPVGIDAGLVAVSHTVVFPGCGSRTVVFDGGSRVVEFEGGTRVVEFGGAINAVPF
jgi:hypothetical protein